MSDTDSGLEHMYNLKYLKYKKKYLELKRLEREQNGGLFTFKSGDYTFFGSKNVFEKELNISTSNIRIGANAPSVSDLNKKLNNKCVYRIKLNDTQLELMGRGTNVMKINLDRPYSNTDNNELFTMLNAICNKQNLDTSINTAINTAITITVGGGISRNKYKDIQFSVELQGQPQMRSQGQPQMRSQRQEQPQMRSQRQEQPQMMSQRQEQPQMRSQGQPQRQEQPQMRSQGQPQMRSQMW